MPLFCFVTSVLAADQQTTASQRDEKTHSSMAHSTYNKYTHRLNMPPVWTETRPAGPLRRVMPHSQTARGRRRITQSLRQNLTSTPSPPESDQHTTQSHLASTPHTQSQPDARRTQSQSDARRTLSQPDARRTSNLTGQPTHRLLDRLLGGHTSIPHGAELSNQPSLDTRVSAGAGISSGQLSCVRPTRGTHSALRRCHEQRQNACAHPLLSPDTGSGRLALHACGSLTCSNAARGG